MDHPIEELDTAVRTYNALLNAGFYTVEQVLDAAPSDILAIAALGTRCRRDVWRGVNLWIKQQKLARRKGHV
jgi:DNA-directed RNA polymerase alpha subunit